MKRNNRPDFAREIMNAMNSRAKCKEIIVSMASGLTGKVERMPYPAHMIELLKTEPRALEIMDADTGEILWTR